MGLLEQRVVIITGAGMGLGRELAIRFAKEGAKVAACDRDPLKMKALESALGEHQASVLAVVADVSQEQDVRSFVNQTQAAFGRVDVLINNAAVFENFSVADTSLDSWNDQWRNNVSSVFLMTRECIPLMRKQKSGQILNLTSSLAKTGASGFGPYSASKAAVEALTYSIDDEEFPNGITAHVINPGVMKTNMQSFGVHPSVVAGKILKFVLENKHQPGQVIELDQVEPDYQI